MYRLSASDSIGINTFFIYGPPQQVIDQKLIAIDQKEQESNVLSTIISLTSKQIKGIELISTVVFASVAVTSQYEVKRAVIANESSNH